MKILFGYGKEEGNEKEDIVRVYNILIVGYG